MSFFNFFSGGSTKGLFDKALVDWNFAKTKSLLTKKGESLITFTRASNGTYFNEAGVMQTATTNAPRFDHKPTTLESLGLLVEEQRTNLLLRSEEFDDASWTKTRSSVTQNAAVAPNGTTTADRLTEDGTATSTHLVLGAGTLTIGTTYTYSVYAKADTRRWLLLSPGGSWGYGWFDVQAGVVGTLVSGGSSATSSIQPVGNGWYRCVITATAVDTRSQVQMLLATGDNVVTYTGDGTSGLYLWGAQLEAGAFPTSYIPTTAAAVTRSADVVSITGSAFSSWYRQDEGTIYTQTVGVPSVATHYNFHDGTSGNRIIAQYSSEIAASWRVVSGGSDQWNATVTIPARALLKHVLSYKVNDFTGCANGGALQMDSLGAVPTVNALSIGQNLVNVGQLNAPMARLVFWPTRLSNTTLQRLTR